MSTPTNEARSRLQTQSPAEGTTTDWTDEQIDALWGRYDQGYDTRRALIGRILAAAQAPAPGDDLAETNAVLLAECDRLRGNLKSVWAKAEAAAGRRGFRLVMQMPQEHVDLVEITPSSAVGAEPVAAQDVLAERQRQISSEGWTPHHDDEHGHGELSKAASAYALGASYPTILGAGNPPDCWPWDVEWWKPSEPRRMLVKAGALILAEIERLDRAGGTT